MGFYPLRKWVQWNYAHKSHQVNNACLQYCQMLGPDLAEQLSWLLHKWYLQWWKWWHLEVWIVSPVDATRLAPPTCQLILLLHLCVHHSSSHHTTRLVSHPAQVNTWVNTHMPRSSTCRAWTMLLPHLTLQSTLWVTIFYSTLPSIHRALIRSSLVAITTVGSIWPTSHRCHPWIPTLSILPQIPLPFNTPPTTLWGTSSSLSTATTVCCLMANISKA